MRGGALITASMAQDYNRPVFAVPGRIGDESSAGCNDLIRDQRAALLQKPDDLIDAMLWATDKRPVQQELQGLETGDTDVTPQQLTLLNLLREAEDGILVNDLVEETNSAYSEVITDIMQLEMKKRVKSLPGGKIMAL